MLLTYCENLKSRPPVGLSFTVDVDFCELKCAVNYLTTKKSKPAWKEDEGKIELSVSYKSFEE